MCVRLILAVGLLALVSGCGDDYSKPVRPGTPPVPRDPNEKLEIPAEFPSEILFYPGATLVSVDTEGDYLSLAYTTTDTYDKVLDTYRTELPKKGWKVSERPTTSGVFLTITKDDVEAYLNFGKTPNGTYIWPNVLKKYVEKHEKKEK